MYLTGSKQSKVDTKGRVTLPAEYRRELDGRICLIPMKDAVHGFTPEGHEAFIEQLFRDGYNPRNPKHVALRRGLTGSTVTVDLDSAGRVCLGKVDSTKLEALGLGVGSDVAIVGATDHVEFWNSEKWAAEQAAFDEELEALMFDQD